MMIKYLPAISLGIIFSIINAIVIVYLTMKAGISIGLEIVFIILAFIIFQSIKNVKREQFLFMGAIISGSTGIIISYTEGYGAILLSGEPFTVPDPVMIALLALSGIIGILLSNYFSGYFLKADFPWPGSKVPASMINVLSEEKKGEEFKSSSKRIGIAGIASGAIASLKNLGLIPENIGRLTSGIGISPMSFGLGMLIGYKTCAQIAIGAIISLMVWLFVESSSADYFTHMRNPWIFSTAISMLVATAIIILWAIVKPGLKSIKKASFYSRDGGDTIFRVQRMKSLSSAEIMLVICLLISGYIFWAFLDAPAWIFLMIIPVSILFMMIEGRGRAETAMSVGVSSFVILLLVGLAFSDVISLLVLEGFVMSMIFSFCAALSVKKIAEYINTSPKNIMAALIIGIATGAVLCIPLLKFFNQAYGIGTEMLPAPYSVMWLEMGRSAVTKAIPASIDPLFILAGVIIAFILYRYKLSAIAIAIGLILPVSTSASIIAGGIFAWYIAKKGWLKNDNGITASGIIAGDIITNIIFSLKFI